MDQIHPVDQERRWDWVSLRIGRKVIETPDVVGTDKGIETGVGTFNRKIISEKCNRETPHSSPKIQDGPGTRYVIYSCTNL